MHPPVPVTRLGSLCECRPAYNGARRPQRCHRQGCRTEATSANKTAGKEQTRIRWNPSYSRWERVTASRDKDGKYTLDNWEKMGVTTVTPKTGTAYTIWPVIHSVLTERGLKTVDIDEAQAMVEKGTTKILDCRHVRDYEKQHIPGALSVPLYRDVQGTGPWDRLKKVVMAGLVMRATERDPGFGEKARAVLDKNKPVIVYCSVGGSIEVGARPKVKSGKTFMDDPEKMFGRESRSLKAVYELQEAGFTKVMHLKGGLSQWRYNGLPTEP